MSLWRLELLRVIRTRRWLALTGVYVFFGLLGPLTARYIAQILKAVGSGQDGVIVQFPDPVPGDGIAQYLSNALQVGTIVVVVIAAGALALDAIPEMGVFLRTRVDDIWQALVPRLVVPFATASIAFVLGTLAAWYETAVLLGPLDPWSMVAGTLLGMLFLAFITALVGAVAQWTRSVLGTVMTSLVALIALPVLGIIPGVSPWMPTRLGNALTELTSSHTPDDLWKCTVTGVVAIGALLWVTGRGAARHRD